MDSGGNMLNTNEHIVRLCEDISYTKGVIKAGTCVLMNLETGLAFYNGDFIDFFDVPVSFVAEREGTC